MKLYVTISKADWGKIKYFYELRSQLIHRKATVSINDAKIGQFRSVVEKVLKKLYGLKFPE